MTETKTKVDLAKRLSFLFGPAPAKHDAEVLLLTCIDFRYFGLIAAHIAGDNLVGKYDHVILAGASLGPVIDFPPEPKLHWQQMFLDHLALSRTLHHVSRVVVLDHRDCGAFKKFGLLPESPSPDEEFNVHKAQALRLECLIRRFEPTIAFEAYLLGLPADHDPLTKEWGKGAEVEALQLA